MPVTARSMMLTVTMTSTLVLLRGTVLMSYFSGFQWASPTGFMSLSFYKPRAENLA